MHRYVAVILCLIGVFAGAAHAQSLSIEPIHVSAGTVLTFHLQTRLNPKDGNEIDVLPKGTVLKVKMLDAVDSGVDHDGVEFHGAVVSSIVAGNEVVVHSQAEVRGILALLRSRNHPEGFRYELLITSVTDQGKTYNLTASLNPSFFEPSPQPASSNAEVREEPKPSTTGAAKLPEPTPH
jgi:hypothetical protein